MFLRYMSLRHMGIRSKYDRRGYVAQGTDQVRLLICRFAHGVNNLINTIPDASYFTRLNGLILPVLVT